MRKIGSLPTEAQARLFVDYLLSRGIKSETDPSSGGAWSVWVHEEGQLEEGERELERFAANPNGSEYTAARGSARKYKQRVERESAEFGRLMIDARTALWRSHVVEGGLATYALIAISIVVTVLAFLPQTRMFVRGWLSIAASQKSGLSALRHGQVWRLITPIFIHFGPLHLLFNMMWLKQLGGEIEDRKGTLYLLAMVLVFAVLSNLGQYYASGPSFGGMSGVVYGLFGYVWMCVKYTPGASYYLEKNTVVLMVGWFFLCMLGVLGPIANTAHAVGLVSGIIWGGVVVRRIPFTNIRF